MQDGSDEFRFGEEIGARFGKSGIVEIRRGRGGLREDGTGRLSLFCIPSNPYAVGRC